jgi:hypothetical protein
MSTPTETTAATRRGPGTPLAGALVFLIPFLAVTFVGAVLQAGPMPLPNAPVGEQVRFLAANTASSTATGVLQALSAAGLAAVVGSVTGARSGGATGRWLPLTIGMAAAGALLVSAALSIVLGVIAPTATADVVAAVRTTSFLTGGVVHVAVLGLFVAAVARRPGWTRPVAVFGLVAAAPAMLSPVSTVWFPASVLLPIGRLLCMAWAVAAGVSLLRGRTRTAA